MDIQSGDSLTSNGLLSTLSRVGKYVLSRAAVLLVTVIVAVYVTILPRGGRRPGPRPSCG